MIFVSIRANSRRCHQQKECATSENITKYIYYRFIYLYALCIIKYTECSGQVETKLIWLVYKLHLDKERYLGEIF